MGVRFTNTFALVSRHTSARPSVTITPRQSVIRLVTVCIKVRRWRVSSKSTDSNVGLVCGSSQVVFVNGTMEWGGSSVSGSGADLSSFRIEYVLYLLVKSRPEVSLLGGCG